jgi:hypothetical protein
MDPLCILRIEIQLTVFVYLFWSIITSAWIMQMSFSLAYLKTFTNVVMWNLLLCDFFTCKSIQVETWSDSCPLFDLCVVVLCGDLLFPVDSQFLLLWTALLWILLYMAFCVNVCHYSGVFLVTIATKPTVFCSCLSLLCDVYWPQLGLFEGMLSHDWWLTRRAAVPLLCGWSGLLCSIMAEYSAPAVLLPFLIEFIITELIVLHSVL